MGDAQLRDRTKARAAWSNAELRAEELIAHGCYATAGLAGSTTAGVFAERGVRCLAGAIAVLADGADPAGVTTDRYTACPPVDSAIAGRLRPAILEELLALAQGKDSRPGLEP